MLRRGHCHNIDGAHEARPRISMGFGKSDILPLCLSLRDYPMRKNENRGFLYYHGSSQNEKYWAALGAFIETFAVVEDVLNSFLISYAKVTPGVGRALFSGTRCDAAIDNVRRIRTVKRAPQDEGLETVFVHLKAISNVRNFLVHYEHVGKDDDRIVSDRSRALTPDRVREHRVSSALLNEMTRDLHYIANRLNFRRWNPGGLRLETYSSHTRHVLTAAWQYIPPQDHQTKAPKRKRLGRRKRRVQSSLQQTSPV
jgi:hypothetical protein